MSATEVKPFVAKCIEGETHRYDGGNIKDAGYGWSTEKWGNMDVAWSGGKSIIIHQSNANVLHAEDGVILAEITIANSLAVNMYSIIIDTVLGEAVWSQVHSSFMGEARQIKVRSQNFMCAITWLN